MRYYIDCEFIDDGKTIDLISIGIVAEDGREYYAQSIEFDANKASDWVQENVFLNLYPYNTAYRVKCWSTREQIKREVLAFMDVEKYGKPELWGWCAGYDFVAFCQLFGTMMDLPAGYPHYIKEIQFLLDEHGLSDDQLPADNHNGQAHNALADARYIGQLWTYLDQIERE